ncbi:MAG TPA: type II secretion system protein [Candidatus Paceibacterota bacterium]|nr:type II secretion system protein [Candidatus Paceibacterota bacterium]
MNRTKKRSPLGWYPITFIGGLATSLYATVPIYLVYFDSLGFVTSTTRAMAVGGMVFVTICVAVARRQGRKLFARKPGQDVWEGFTLIELLIVISIIGILAAILFPFFGKAKESAYLARSKVEMRSLDTALEMYANDHGNYPPDANRGLPPGLEAYLSGNNWPNAPWPGSVYDWDAWAPSDLSYPPYAQVYQISIRFCPANAPDQCQFPDEPWAQNFDYYSAVYYCVSGPCRAHSSEPVDHPGYCLNC